MVLVGENLAEKFRFWFCMKWWIPMSHKVHDNANTPQVTAYIVVTWGLQNFGSHIVWSSNSCLHSFGRIFQNLRQPKIDHFNILSLLREIAKSPFLFKLLRKQDVFWLQISMTNVSFVEMLDCLTNPQSDPSTIFVAQGPILLNIRK